MVFSWRNAEDRCRPGFLGVSSALNDESPLEPLHKLIHDEPFHVNDIVYTKALSVPEIIF